MEEQKEPFVELTRNISLETHSVCVSSFVLLKSEVETLVQEESFLSPRPHC